MEKKNKNAWPQFTLEQMQEQASEDYMLAYLYVPVSHFEAIDLIKQQLNLTSE